MKKIVKRSRSLVSNEYEKQMSSILYTLPKKYFNSFEH